MAPLKTWCTQILGPDQRSLTYRKVNEPFDHLPFQMALAATFGGDINLSTNSVVHMPVVSFEALAFTALAVSWRMWDLLMSIHRFTRCLQDLDVGGQVGAKF